LRQDYIVEFQIANGEALAISVPAGETRVRTIQVGPKDLPAPLRQVERAVD
jgi:hypothetical protein